MYKFILAFCCAGLLLGQVSAARADDAGDIKSLLMAKFDKPQARLAVAPVVIRGDHAVAGWIQAERGGRALLRRDHGKWKLVACAGDAFKEAAELQKAGLTAGDARALAKSLASAEAKLPAAQAAKLSLFEGVVAMDADGGHLPHAHGDHPGGKP